MHLAVSVSGNEALDSVLNDFKEGYLTLSSNDRNKLLLGLAKEYYVDDIQVEQLIDQYLIRLLEIFPRNEMEPHDDLNALYSIERNLKYALRPDYDILFDRLHRSSRGFKFLCTLQVDILSLLTKENAPSLRALELQLKDRIRGYWLTCGMNWRRET
ncbi:PREDICTED: uncharacterized protein LOC104707664 [Camelina sativa]|uniref:Uncharacterized protein LOC104707664 n=1 Tax=Camelina sativa TaxID=90675 RepID=A0ABM1QD61_CAMSA|nr:PREDICTED: uncharacterized protein LOC104707664 [Camelina sativa]